MKLKHIPQRDFISCGAAATTSVLHTFGCEVTFGDIKCVMRPGDWWPFTGVRPWTITKTLEMFGLGVLPMNWAKPGDVGIGLAKEWHHWVSWRLSKSGNTLEIGDPLDAKIRRMDPKLFRRLYPRGFVVREKSRCGTGPSAISWLTVL